MSLRPLNLETLQPELVRYLRFLAERISDGSAQPLAVETQIDSDGVSRFSISYTIAKPFSIGSPATKRKRKR